MNVHDAAEARSAKAAALGFTEPPPITGRRDQCNSKVDAETYWRFKRACVLRGESYASVLERIMEIYTAQVEGTKVLHMDGQECPLSVLIAGLAASASGMMSQ